MRVTEAEWRAVNALARRRGTSVDALLREWGVRRLLELARTGEGDVPGPDGG